MEDSLASFQKLIETGQGEWSWIERVLHSSAFPFWITPFTFIDPYESWLMIETVETSERLEWKAIHFVAFRKLNSDTSATISELPFSSLSLWVEKK